MSLHVHRSLRSPSLLLHLPPASTTLLSVTPLLPPSLSLSLSLSLSRADSMAMTKLEVHQEEEDDGDDEESDESGGFDGNLMSSKLVEAEVGWGPPGGNRQCGQQRRWRQQFPPILAIVAAALRKSLVTCSVETREDVCSSMDIGWPTNVQHIAHVTFDRFQGFLGLPVELEHDVLRTAPSASVSVFGVSAESMQCSIDTRGNSVPTILLLMQQHLYSQGGLHAEGIFRINAENSQEVYVRDQLNKGIVPKGVELHCLAGLIKAWFRELPSGVLDSLTPDQVMHCNTEKQCSQLVSILPPTEAALLDWAINLMADVVQCEHHNKMNARNIAMVFAPNMTQMADPLTALIHAVQVMNFLKMLIVKTLREREEAAAVTLSSSSASSSPSDKDEVNMSEGHINFHQSFQEKTDVSGVDNSNIDNFMLNDECVVESDDVESFWSFEKDSTTAERMELVHERSSPISSNKCTAEKYKGAFGGGDDRAKDRLSFRDGVKKLCRHPVFLLSRSIRRTRDQGIVNSSVEGREGAWV